VPLSLNEARLRNSVELGVNVAVVVTGTKTELGALVDCAVESEALFLSGSAVVAIEGQAASNAA
jgi:hypothetical protein